MTEEEYEARYHAALVHLTLHGDKVGTPEKLGDFRFCWVNGEALNDEDVFGRAWGLEVASKIIERRDV